MLDHHALLLTGTYAWALTALPLPYRREAIDVLHYHGERMGIDEVRSLIEEAYKTPLSGDERIFILAYRSYTEQSQNALLKLLEEPPKTARFFLVTERPDMLLPTLRSRLMVMDSELRRENEDHLSFFRLSKGEQLTSLMETFEVHAHETRNVVFIQMLLALKPTFHMPGASRKMILEHLTLSLPPHAEVR
jgi:hypothetical protein